MNKHPPYFVILDRHTIKFALDGESFQVSDMRLDIRFSSRKLTNLQEAEDEYYLTASYLLQLTNRAYDLFASSEIEQKRQLLKLVLQNLTLEGRKVRYEAIKPLETILNFADHKLVLRGMESIRTFHSHQFMSS